MTRARGRSSTCSAAFANVVRFNGGNNAGHTVKFADRHFALHLIPSGILQPDCRCLIGPGVVIDPVALVEEMRMLEEQGVSVRSRLPSRPRATSCSPATAPSTSRARRRAAPPSSAPPAAGIGPTYEGRAARTGVRLGLARNPRRLREAVATCERRARAGDRSLRGPARLRRRRSSRRRPPSPSLRCSATSRGARRRRDAAGQADPVRGRTGHAARPRPRHLPVRDLVGMPRGVRGPGVRALPARIDGVLGVFKAYTTRVGSGPVPDRARRRHRRAPPAARQRVRHHHRPPPPHRLVRRRGGSRSPCAGTASTPWRSPSSTSSTASTTLNLCTRYRGIEEASFEGLSLPPDRHAPGGGRLRASSPAGTRKSPRLPRGARPAPGRARLPRVHRGVRRRAGLLIGVGQGRNQIIWTEAGRSSAAARAAAPA